MAYYSESVPEGDYDRRYHDQEQRKMSDSSIYTDQRLATLEAAIIQLDVAGYGGMDLATPVAFDITAGYSTVPFDALSPAVPRGVTFDLVNNTFTMTQAGVWQFIYNMNLSGHNSTNGGRNFNLRLWNVTLGQLVSKELSQGIGRNETYTLVSVSTLIEVPQIAVDDSHVYRIEVGGADAVTGGTLTIDIAQFVYESELGIL